MATTVKRQDLSEDLEQAVKEALQPQSLSKRLKKLVKGKEETVKQIAASSDAPIVLDPETTSCNKFAHTDGLLLFNILGMPILHGWVLDPKDNDLMFIKDDSHSRFAEKIAEAEQNNGGDPLIERLHEFRNASIKLSVCISCTEKLKKGTSLFCITKTNITFYISAKANYSPSKQLRRLR